MIKKAIQDFFGGLQVAAPSTTYYPIHYQGIKLDRDAVISGSVLMFDNTTPVEPTYEYSFLDTNTFTSWYGRFFRAIPLLGAIIQELDISFGGSFFHAMDYVYLSPQIYAKKINKEDGTRGPAQSMETIFKENMFELASKLENNCDTPKISIDVAGALVDPNDSSKFNYINNTFFGNVTTVNFKDLNDTDDSTNFEVSYYNYNFYYISEAEKHRGYSVDKKIVSNVKSISDFSIPISLQNYDDCCESYKQIWINN